MPPPYSSVRWLRSGDRNEPASMYLWAACNSTQSQPASLARLAASPYCSMIFLISSRVSSRHTCPCLLLTTAEGPTG